MTNEKFSDFCLNISQHAKIYLRFVAVVFVVAGGICAGLYMGLFSFVDRVNAYILADELLGSMIRSMSAAAMMALVIDLLARKYGED